LSSQVLTEQALSAWVSYLRGHATVTRELNAQLVTEHGLTINDYEVLLHLSHAPERSMRRVDLAASVLLTPSGITRLLDGLQEAGYVCKRNCDSDARVTYAVLTDAGLDKLRSASHSHAGGVQRLFSEHFSDDELETLSTLLARLGGGADGETCRAG
jgi:DNA-binding MarR family transcriptional regulator